MLLIKRETLLLLFPSIVLLEEGLKRNNFRSFVHEFMIFFFLRCAIVGCGCWYLRVSFFVKSVRDYIDDILLLKEPVQTSWVKVVPIKVNILSWRVWLDNISTRFNLSSRGLEIHSLSCPLCNVLVESTSHLFFSCSLAQQLWNKVFRWWDIDASDFLSYDEWLTLLKNIRMPKGTDIAKISRKRSKPDKHGHGKG
ncbi:RNA-directed DNA polymerase, eukaryota [Tanacetum coccineum]